MIDRDDVAIKALEAQAAIAALERVKGLIQDDARYNARRCNAAIEARRWQDAHNHQLAVDVGFDDTALVQGEIERIRQEIVRLAKCGAT